MKSSSLKADARGDEYAIHNLRASILTLAPLRRFAALPFSCRHLRVWQRLGFVAHLGRHGLAVQARGHRKLADVRFRAFKRQARRASSIRSSRSASSRWECFRPKASASRTTGRITRAQASSTQPICFRLRCLPRRSARSCLPHAWRFSIQCDWYPKILFPVAVA